MNLSVRGIQLVTWTEPSILKPATEILLPNPRFPSRRRHKQRAGRKALAVPGAVGRRFAAMITCRLVEIVPEPGKSAYAHTAATTPMSSGNRTADDATELLHAQSANLAQSHQSYRGTDPFSRGHPASRSS